MMRTLRSWLAGVRVSTTTSPPGWRSWSESSEELKQ